MQVSYEFSKAILNNKLNGTPVTMLMPKEMSKKVEFKQKAPTVVAKLMGLDGLPAQKLNWTLQYHLKEDFVQNASDKAGCKYSYQYEDRGTSCEQVYLDTNPSQAYILRKEVRKDMSGVRHMPLNVNHREDQLHREMIYNENPNDKMTLVRQKFMEAKHLATDEKLRQSKEFQDALEVLSSNKELFLKFLQEPNSLFSVHLHEDESGLKQLQTEHITVLKPSKMMEVNHNATLEFHSDKQIKKRMVIESSSLGKHKVSQVSSLGHETFNIAPKPTRIVVLKPSLGKTPDIKTFVSLPSSHPTFTRNRVFSVDSEAGSVSSRETAKEITHQMRESLNIGGRDESLLSSILSNGYAGDESSFNQSESDFIGGNLSDIEIISPTCRHPWDHIHMSRNSSPCSSSSFSRPSYSPESSVSREAKKRLYERWAMMSSTEISKEHRHIQRSSTLGEMLSLSHNTGHMISREVDGDKEHCGDLELRGGAACFSSSEENYPMTFSKSRSLSASHTAYKDTSNAITPDPMASWKDSTKPKSGGLSLKGKVSSLFFSKNKKLVGKSSPPSLGGYVYGSQSDIIDIKGRGSNIRKFPIDCRSHEITGTDTIEEAYPRDRGGPLCKFRSPFFWAAPKQATSPLKALSPFNKGGTPKNANQDQRGATSVSDASFEDSYIHPKNFKTGSGAQGLLEHLRLNESGLWMRSSAADSLNFREHSEVPSEADLDEEECFSLVQSLLSSAGLDDAKSLPFCKKGNSALGPLDSCLLENFMNRKDFEQQPSEAKRRKCRSERRLLFDSVNVVLMDMSEYALSTPCNRPISFKGESVTEEVWRQVREWWFHCSADSHCGKGNMAFMADRKEIAVRRKWEEGMYLEVDRIGEEIEGDVLKQLLQEAIGEFYQGN